MFQSKLLRQCVSFESLHKIYCNNSCLLMMCSVVQQLQLWVIDRQASKSKNKEWTAVHEEMLSDLCSKTMLKRKLRKKIIWSNNGYSQKWNIALFAHAALVFSHLHIWQSQRIYRLERYNICFQHFKQYSWQENHDQTEVKGHSCEQRRTKEYLLRIQTVFNFFVIIFILIHWHFTGKTGSSRAFSFTLRLQ